MDVVLDIEANGLLDKVTKAWCAVAYDIHEDKYYEFELHEDQEDFKRFMDGVNLWIGHNIIDYDIPLLRLLGIYSYTRDVCDTLLMSRALNPDRKLPDGCPTHVWDESQGKHKLVGKQSLEAWGYRVARAKPSVDRWDKWDEKILHRCREDVKINAMTLDALLKEGELTCPPRMTILLPERWT